jgi:23S rRNA pseudouridine2605 synthase
LRSIWRAEDAEQVSSTRTTPKAPRRGADPKEIRTENAEREHRRSGSIKTRGGKSVLVEKLAPSRKEAPVRERADVEASRPKEPFKPRKPRPEGESNDTAPKREWSPGGRSVANRSAAKPSGERPTTGRADSKPYRGGRLSGGKPSGDKPSGGRPSGGAARGPRPPRSR